MEILFVLVCAQIFDFAGMLDFFSIVELPNTHRFFHVYVPYYISSFTLIARKTSENFRLLCLIVFTYSCSNFAVDFNVQKPQHN